MTTQEIPLRERFEAFFGATGDEVDAVLAHVHRVELEGGQWLFREGEAGDSIYFMVRGRLEIWITPPGAEPGAGSAPPHLRQTMLVFRRSRCVAQSLPPTVMSLASHAARRPATEDH